MNDIISVPQYNEKTIILVKSYRHSINGSECRFRLSMHEFGNILKDLNLFNFYIKYFKPISNWERLIFLLEQDNMKLHKELIERKFFTEKVFMFDNDQILKNPKISNKRKEKVIESKILNKKPIAIRYVEIRHPVVSYLEQKNLISKKDVDWLKQLFNTEKGSTNDFFEYLDKKSAFLIDTIKPDFNNTVQQEAEKQFEKRLKYYDKLKTKTFDKVHIDLKKFKVGIDKKHETRENNKRIVIEKIKKFKLGQYGIINRSRLHIPFNDNSYWNTHQVKRELDYFHKNIRFIEERNYFSIYIIRVEEYTIKYLKEFKEFVNQVNKEKIKN